MTQEQVNQFVRIYNTLCTVSTRGEDTIVMGECLRAMQVLAQEIQIIENDKSEPQGE